MSRFTKRRLLARKEREERFGRLDASLKQTLAFIKILRECQPIPESTYHCSDCKHWICGDFWGAGEHGIESEGVCNVSHVPCWNYRKACKIHFDENEKLGFIMCGSGEPTNEQINIIVNKTEELINKIFND